MKENKESMLANARLMPKNDTDYLYFGMAICFSSIERMVISYIATDESCNIYGYGAKPVWRDGEWVLEGCRNIDKISILIGRCESVTDPELSLMEI